MWRQAETRVMHLQDEECQGVPANTGGWKEARKDLLEPSERAWPSDTLISDSGLQSCKTKVFC